MPLSAPSQYLTKLLPIKSAPLVTNIARVFIVSRRERRASESEVKLDQRPKSSQDDGGGGGVAGGGGGGGGMLNGIGGSMNVDIMQMLSKAQDEYDQVIIRLMQ